MILEIEDIHVKIGPVEALRGFTLSVAAGEMLVLSGRNGAGKTTVMKTVMGLNRPVAGRVVFDNTPLSSVSVHHRAALGIGYMPEDRGLVPELSVEENILLPVWVTKALPEAERMATVYDILPELREMRERKALLLSGGQQKLVALARALAAGTRLLLLDEPFEGVAPALAQRLAQVIAGLRGQGMAMILSQSELNEYFDVFDREVTIERGANSQMADG